MTGDGLQSALIIEVPEAEPAVRRHRDRLDSNALLGIPAHITVLAPFMPADMIDVNQLGRLFADVTGFRLVLDHTDWFGEQVLWLAPRDPAPFRALTDRVYQAYPAFPPFEGRHDDVVPHLTIGHGHPLDELRDAEAAVQLYLPIKASVDAVTLMTEQYDGGHWLTTATFALMS